MNTKQKHYNTSVSSGLVEESSLTDGEAILHTVVFQCMLSPQLRPTLMPSPRVEIVWE